MKTASLRAVNTAQSRPAIQDLLIKEDDYSIQVETPRDRMFWLRIERSEEEPVRVSDLKKSTLAIEDVAYALDLAVAKIRPNSTIRELRFLDIAPARGPDAVDLEAANVAKIVVLFAKIRGLRVGAIQTGKRGSKTDVIVDLLPTFPG
jgi:hypothetical protein